MEIFLQISSLLCQKAVNFFQYKVMLVLELCGTKLRVINITSIPINKWGLIMTESVCVIHSFRVLAAKK